MSCGCGSCIETSVICIPRGDRKSVIVSVYDEDKDEVDISTAFEIVFIIADGVFIGGNIGPGGVVHVEKRLSTGGISIAGTLFQFVVSINGADTESLTRTNYYWEAAIETATGERNTIAAGLFKSDNTMIRDLV